MAMKRKVWVGVIEVLERRTFSGNENWYFKRSGKCSLYKHQSRIHAPASSLYSIQQRLQGQLVSSSTSPMYYVSCIVAHGQLASVRINTRGRLEIASVAVQGFASTSSALERSRQLSHSNQHYVALEVAHKQVFPVPGMPITEWTG